MKKILILLLLGTMQFAHADALDDALLIVMKQSAVVSMAQTQAGIVRGTSSVNTKLRLVTGYSDKSNDAYSVGVQSRGMISIEIPLTGSGASKNDKSRAIALGNLYKAKDDLADKFIRDVQGLMVLKRGLDIDIRLHERAVDEAKRLEILNKGLSEHEKLDLVPVFDRALERQYKVEMKGSEYKIKVVSLSRIYGKKKWLELKGVILNYINLIVLPLPKLFEEAK